MVCSCHPCIASRLIHSLQIFDFLELARIPFASVTRHELVLFHFYLVLWAISTQPSLVATGMYWEWCKCSLLPMCNVISTAPGVETPDNVQECLPTSLRYSCNCP